ncbi:Leucine-rich receptor-like protein kinase family protein [Rhynchospora pubera]|uniref:non-specific serine/threonine protein kinase n=1 Tax=Rhynchospora pubera TaxID=906938 RepID=A0AAV8HLU8_9POAL|nr:Leucine-rich receptor-like protein kinase family protein [Rhynchospora pubera]
MILTNGTTKALFLILALLSVPHLNTACTDQERQTLISFLSSLSTPILSWNATDESDCCKWEGISCSPFSFVTQISLPSKGLTGEISPFLTNLTQLSYLNLSSNFLSGPLPVELLSLSTSLAVLDVSFNKLSGPIPGFQNPVIQVLNISSNFFTGLLPIINATSLLSLNATNNSLSGSIPDYLCANSLSLSSLSISYNKFSGKILPGLGNCTALREFYAASNNLTGSLPNELFELASLQHLSLSTNRIHGSLNGALIARLENLVTLDLGLNFLTGSIPESIGQLNNLCYLHLSNNNLTGTLPSAIVNCTKLRQLNLRENNLTGSLQSFNFTRLSNLQLLDLFNNNFTGEIPETIYTCKNLNAVRVSSNNLTGQISPDIINLKALSFLSLSGNPFVNITGTLQILSKCKNLTALLISRSFIDEAPPIEPTWENGFENIQIFSMGYSNLTGTIPSWISKMTKLEVLDLSSNQFTGQVPAWLGSLSSLFYLDLSHNHLSGKIPQSIAHLPLLDSVHKIKKLDPGYLELPLYSKPYNGSRQQYKQLTALPPTINLGTNQLNGTIPEEIGHLIMLHVLDLSQNNISGPIPNSLGNLTNLETLDLSRNNLSGIIPASLGQLNFLSTFTVAFNNLSGPIPTGGQFNTFSNSSYEGNSNLCGPVVMRKCSNQSNGDYKAPITAKRFNKKTVIAVVLGIFFGVAAVVLLLGYYFTCSRSGKHKLHDGKMGLPVRSFNSFSEVQFDLIKDADLVMVKGETGITLQDILNATNNFDQSSIVGCGGFGLVYKADLATGGKLAIKRLSGNSWLMEREFKAEVEALSVAQHENLVPLKGYCIQGDLRLLIYSYMENGSLDDWLHDQGGHLSDSDSDLNFNCQLDWPTRLRIAQGASRGLSYIHEVCRPHIVHRDIKSSNILLDDKFEARVADFGLARLIHPYMTHVTTELIGTLGYIPPEYGQGCVATLRGDIYSFGVVMLELVTGKRAVEVLPNKSVELVQWVRELKSVGQELEVFDPFLRGKGYDRDMLKVLDVACLCVDHNPVNRPSIQQVVTWLKNIDANSPS